MATKAVKTRNPERRSGKAWGKNHNASDKVLSQETKDRMAARKSKRSQETKSDRGLNVTMPKITWGWATEILRHRWPNTRKTRVIDMYTSMSKGSVDPNNGVPLAVEVSSEVKSSRKSTASSRKNGR